MSSVYVWLKGTELVYDVARKVQITTRTDCVTQKRFVDVHDGINPIACFPDIPEELIEKFTFKEKIGRESTDIREGIYRLEGDENTELQIREMPGYIKEKYISISSKSLGSLRKIYSLVRQGKLEPVENWQKM